jgi:hypothetical protein
MRDTGRVSEADDGRLRADVEWLLGGYRLTQLIYVAVRLELPDLLGDRTLTASDLAAAAGSHPEATGRLLAALADIDLVDRCADGTYRLTATGRLLRSDVPDGLRAAALTYGAAWWWGAFGQLEDAVRTGATGFDLAFDQPLFEWLAGHPDAAAVFDANMAVMTGRDTAAILACGFPFDAVAQLVDVGGGRGQFCRAFLTRYPQASATLVDRPDVVADAHDESDPATRGRLSVHAGSFFDPLPTGGDVYLLKDIVHDWDDATAVRILQRCADAARPSGRVVVVERLLDDPDHGAAVRRVDITMLALTGGRERTLAEYTALLADAGLEVTSVARATGGYSLIASHP